MGRYDLPQRCAVAGNMHCSAACGSPMCTIHHDSCRDMDFDVLANAKTSVNIASARNLAAYYRTNGDIGRADRLLVRLGISESKELYTGGPHKISTDARQQDPPELFHQELLGMACLFLVTLFDSFTAAAKRGFNVRTARLDVSELYTQFPSVVRLSSSKEKFKNFRGSDYGTHMEVLPLILRGWLTPSMLKEGAPSGVTLL
jgi:hypothetical protein